MLVRWAKTRQQDELCLIVSDVAVKLLKCWSQLGKEAIKENCHARFSVYWDLIREMSMMVCSLRITDSIQT